MKKLAFQINSSYWKKRHGIHQITLKKIVNHTIARDFNLDSIKPHVFAFNFKKNLSNAYGLDNINHFKNSYPKKNN